MAIPNLIGLIGLREVIVSETNLYFNHQATSNSAQVIEER